MAKATGAIKTGVIGAGRMGAGFHADHLARTRKFELTAICDTDDAVLARAKRRFKVPTYASLEEVLGQADVELVVIATPTILHAEQAMLALRAGKHVVVEAPLCLTARDADALASATRQYRRKLAVFHRHRWDSDFLTLHKTLQSDKLGAVFALQRRVSVSASAWAPATDSQTPWRLARAAGGGIGYDWGYHLVDQVLQLVPSEPEIIFGDAQARKLTTEVDDHFTCLIRFRNRTLALLEASACARARAASWSVLGTKGSLQGDERKLKGEAGRDAHAKEFVPRMAKGDPAGFYAKLHKAITTGEELEVTLGQARQVVLIIEAAYRSSRIGCAVRLTGFE
jgi:scyllo-inositol 2-dehydrogenase (NADP+)